MADVRIHGTTHERPLDRFGREQLIPLGTRPPYRYERVRMRRVANDALVAVGAARYSVPAEYVGALVSVQESAEHYEFLHEGLVARHQKAARHSVVMEPAHYAGLLRVSREAAVPPAPRFDPNFSRLGEVMVRDLALYEAASQSEGGEVR